MSWEVVMVGRPGSLLEFEAQFPDDAACAGWLFEKRWPDGFRCPGCGHNKGWELERGVLWSSVPAAIARPR